MLYSPSQIILKHPRPTQRCNLSGLQSGRGGNLNNVVFSRTSLIHGRDELHSGFLATPLLATSRLNPGANWQSRAMSIISVSKTRWTHPTCLLGLALVLLCRASPRSATVRSTSTEVGFEFSIYVLKVPFLNSCTRPLQLGFLSVFLTQRSLQWTFHVTATSIHGYTSDTSPNIDIAKKKKKGAEKVHIC